MNRKRINYLKQIYKQNPDNEAFIIEVLLDDYNDVFNGWDPSPLRRRDLDHELLDFIEECAFDIPLKYPVELQFFMPKELYDEKKEQLTQIGIENNFHFIIHFMKKELKDNFRKVASYIILSFIFLALSYFANKYVTSALLANTLVQGLFIGGWVFLWEAFSLFFFSGQDTRARLRRYNRFLKAPVRFNYNEV